MSKRRRNKPKKRRSLARRVGRWVLFSVVLLAGLLYIAGLSLAGRNLTAPVWLTAQLMERVNAGLPAGRITLERLQVQVDRAGIPRISLGDLGIFDDRGSEIIRLNNVGASFSVSSLFAGEIKPDQVRLSGAQMTLRRQTDGQFDVSFGSGSAATGTLPNVLDLIDKAFLAPPLDQISALAADDLTITLEDARSGRLWQITEGAIQVHRGDTGLDISVTFDVFNGTEELAETVLGIQTDATSSRASIGSTFKNAAAADIALQSPVLSFLGVLDAPISGSVRTEFDADGALETLAGTLEIGAGRLQPGVDIKPVSFRAAKSYFSFDPLDQKIEFSEISFESDAASLVAQGRAYLRDMKDGWPSTLLGQFSLSEIKAHPDGVFENEISFSQGAADFRLRLNPFAIEIGQLVLIEGDDKIVAKGAVAADPSGWDLRGDLTLNQISRDRLLAIWPLAFSPNTRNWLSDNMTSGVLSDVKAAIRLKPGQPLRRTIGWKFQDTSVRYINSQPEIENASGYGTIDGNTFTLVVENGTVTPPLGGLITVADTSIQIPDLTIKPAPIQVRLKGNASNTAVLSLLDQPPFDILRNASFGPDISGGRTDFDATIDFTLKRQIALPDVRYSVTGVLSDVTTERLVTGRLLSADRLDLVADNQRVEISGPMRLGQVATEMIWRQDLRDGQTGQSTVDGTVELSQAFVSEFGIGLPDGAVQGAGLANFHVELRKNEPPSFTLNSDLNRVGLRINQIGWVKPKNATGKLSVAGTLGANPKIDLLEINATGLNATGGQVTIAQDGSMQAASFKRVRVGGWLDAPVRLRGRGPGVVPAVTVPGGTIDIRKTAFAGGTSQTGGPGGPISLNMDRVIISEGMALTDFVGEFDSSGGISGTFKARMNGQARLSGRLAPERNGTAIRVTSDNAGAVLRSAGVVEYANNGQMDLTLRPRKENGVYNGQMLITRTNVVNAPGMTDLLSAISIVGLLEQLSGTGILFERVEATFRLSPNSVQLIRSSAVGPSLGISLDGVYDLTTSTMDMQGVVSPVFFLNAIGQLVSPRRGEGLFGFNFRLRGTNTNPKVSVNPLSILTPGIFRDIFRTPPPTPKN